MQERKAVPSGGYLGQPKIWSHFCDYHCRQVLEGKQLENYIAGDKSFGPDMVSYVKLCWPQAAQKVVPSLPVVFF